MANLLYSTGIPIANSLYSTGALAANYSGKLAASWQHSGGILYRTLARNFDNKPTRILYRIPAQNADGKLAAFWQHSDGKLAEFCHEFYHNST